MLPANIVETEFEYLKNELYNKKYESSFNTLLVEKKKLKELIVLLNIKIDNLLTFCYFKNENTEPCFYQLINIIEILPKLNEFCEKVKIIFLKNLKNS